MKVDDNLQREYQRLAREIASGSIVTQALARLLEQVIEEAVGHGAATIARLTAENEALRAAPQAGVTEAMVRRAVSTYLDEAVAWYRRHREIVPLDLSILNDPMRAALTAALSAQQGEGET